LVSAHIYGAILGSIRRPQIAASKIKYQEVKGQASKTEVILLQGSNTAAGSNTTAGKWNPGSLTAGEVKTLLGYIHFSGVTSTARSFTKLAGMTQHTSPRTEREGKSQKQN
jgi:hypothetical protein